MTRKSNPMVAYAKAREVAERARRAHARADDLADKARIAAEAAKVLAALKDDAEREEANALEALQAHLATLGVNTKVDTGE